MNESGHLSAASNGLNTRQGPDSHSAISQRVRRTIIAAILFVMALAVYLGTQFFPRIPDPLPEFFLALTAAMAVHLLDRLWLFRDTAESLDQLRNQIVANVATETGGLIGQLDERTKQAMNDIRNGIQHLIKRGLDRAYISETSDIPGIRGKLEISASIKRRGRVDGRAVCTFDELSHDVLHNQLLKASLIRLVRTDQIDSGLRRELSDLLLRFANVRTIALRNEAFRQVQLHSNNRFYRLLLSVCALLHRQMLPDSTGATYRFVDFSEEQLDTIFQSFVRNFFAHHQSIYRVSAERLRWQRTIANESVLSYMPTMMTDVSMESPTRKLVIETKFYEKTLRRHHRDDDKGKVNSSHLYQLFAYLQNLGVRDNRAIDGLLLYAQAEDELFLELNMFGHDIRIATIDLASSPESIGARLFRCAGIEVASQVAA
jgi:5-methylcytosine-specific restriction enzyme subunit McrC